jgi:hypothetical protein
MSIWKISQQSLSKFLKPSFLLKSFGRRSLFRAAQLVALGVGSSCGMAGEEAMYSPEYRRSDWSHWRDFDGDCQDARQEVLIGSSLEPVVFADRKGCRVSSGAWEDPYTGGIVRDAGSLDIDHVVTLKDAFDSGGFMWPKEKRVQFANDPENLLAVSASENRSKGSKGPDEWLPRNPEYRCEYISKWMGVKAKYDLSLNPCERSMVEYMMRSCGDGKVPSRP